MKGIVNYKNGILHHGELDDVEIPSKHGFSFPGRKRLMQNFKVEKDIPIPEIKERASKYPFAQMEVGDSFLVKDKRIKQNVESMMYYHSKKWNKRFTLRTVSEGVRVWRVS